MTKTDHTTTPLTEAQRAARSANAEKATAGRRAAVAARRAEAEAQVEAADLPHIRVSEARLMAAKAELAEIDVAERRGELISVAQARADVFDKFTTVRTKILGVPSRVAQRMPHHAAEIVPVLKELLREALAELAGGDADE